MPMLGLTMEEGTVAEWLKAEGDSVAKDEPLLTVEMDKGIVEVPAPTSGVLSRILVQPGVTVAVKTPIAEIESSSASPAAAPAPAAPSAPAPAAPPRPAAPPSPATAPVPAGGPGDLPPRVPSPPPVAAAASANAASAAPPAGGPGDLPAGSRRFSSPRARMRARELGLDLSQLRGSGPRGRIVEADVLAASSETRVVATPLARRLAEEHGVDLATLRGTGPGGRVTQDD